MLQNSECTRCQKLSSMLRRNHSVVQYFWRLSSFSNGGQVEVLLEDGAGGFAGGAAGGAGGAAGGFAGGQLDLDLCVRSRVV